MTNGGDRRSRSAGRPPGRPPKRKVERPGAAPTGPGAVDADVPIDAETDGAAGSGPPSRPTRRRAAPRPWYRQGRVWFAVIAAEAVIALIVSIRFTPSTTDVSLDGADLPTFCRQVTEFRASRPAVNPELTSPEAAADLQAQADTYRRLRSSAPDELEPDLDVLIESLDEMANAAREARRRTEADPSYSGLSELLATEQSLARRSERADARVAVVLQRGCGIDEARPVPTTTEPVAGPPVEVPPASTTPGTGAGPGGEPTPTTAAAPADTTPTTPAAAVPSDPPTTTRAL